MAMRSQIESKLVRLVSIKRKAPMNSRPQTLRIVFIM